MRQAVHTVLRARTNAVKTLPLSARGKGPSISCNPLALTSRRGGARNLATESESKRDKIILKGAFVARSVETRARSLVSRRLWFQGWFSTDTTEFTSLNATVAKSSSWTWSW